MAGSVLIWAPPGRGRRVPEPRKGYFGRRKNPGFVGPKKKNPAGMGTRNSQVFNKNGLFSAPKHPGACLGGRKKPLREARGLIPWFWARTGLEPHPDGAIPALAEGVAQHAPPQQQEPHLGVRTRCLRGASSVCQTTGQSDDGGPFGQGIPRSEPSFYDTKSHFLTSFQRRKIKFSDA